MPINNRESSTDPQDLCLHKPHGTLDTDSKLSHLLVFNMTLSFTKKIIYPTCNGSLWNTLSYSLRYVSFGLEISGWMRILKIDSGATLPSLNGWEYTSQLRCSYPSHGLYRRIQRARWGVWPVIKDACYEVLECRGDLIFKSKFSSLLAGVFKS